MSLSIGLPLSRADWPPEVLDSSARFSCGDVVENPPYFYFANPEFAVMDLTRRYDDGQSNGPEIIDAGEIATPFGIITSQTCDVREVDFDPPSKPFISVAPVFDATDRLPKETLSLLKKGKQIQAWLHLPALSEVRTGLWVADFRIELPVEKSWLVGREPIKGFHDEADARRVPAAVADIRTRPAWATVVIENVQAVLDAELRTLKRENPPLYNSAVSEIDEVGARSDSMLQPSFVQMAAFYETAISDAVASWWTDVTDRVAARLAALGVSAHEPLLLDLLECPVAKYRAFAPVLLGRHSPR